MLGLALGCSNDTAENAPLDPNRGFGQTHAGEYHLGPVDCEESVWTNACSPYDPAVIDREGEVLVGLSTQHMDGGRLCDACILITEDTGTQVNARIITYGDTAPNDLDLGPVACAALSGDAACDLWPRHMTWQFAPCPDTGRIAYQFQTEANVWWTSLWVRNARLPLARAEVKSANHPTWSELERGSDGSLTDGAGFGEGDFSIRVTAIDGQSVTDTFPRFFPGQLLESSGQFH